MTDPNAIQGSPETTSPATQTPPAAAPEAKAEEVLYEGLGVKIKGIDELKNYLKILEEGLVQAKAASGAQGAAPIVPQVSPPEPSAKERYAELIFSNPADAFEIAVGEAEKRVEKKRAAEREVEDFWKSFYTENQDLKGVERVVESIRVTRAQDIAKLKTQKEVSEFLARESRDLIGVVKSKFSTTETTVPHKKVVSLDSSGEPFQAAPGNPAPTPPINFADQLRRMKQRN